MISDKGLMGLLLAAGLMCDFLPSSSFAAPPSQQQTNPDQGREMYRGLRDEIFSVSPGDLGLPAGGPAHGAVMEFDINGETVTVVAFATGDASLYFSTGGGMIGGIGHSAIAEAAKAFVETAGAAVGSLSPADAFPRPGAAEVRFYVLTSEGVSTGTAPMEAVAAGGDALSPLFSAANEVVTQYRLLGQ